MPLSLVDRLSKSRSPLVVGFSVACTAMVLVGLGSYASTKQLRSDSRWVRHTYEVMRLLEELDDEFGARQPPATPAEAQVRLDSLGRLTADNAAQVHRLDSLRVALATSAKDSAHAMIERMQAEEQRLLVARKAQAARAATRTTRIVVLSSTLAIVLIAAALWLLQADLERRRAAELALQESETKHRLLMEQAADAIIIADSHALCVEANARAATLLGRPAGAVRGLPLKAFVEGDRPGSTAVLPMLRFGRVTSGEFWIVRPDGSRVPVEIRAALLADGRIQIIARDIAERKEVERLKDEFVSLVSHELRTPLTSIRGAIGLLASGRLASDPDKQARMLDLASSNTDRLIRLINDILDVERINAGGIALERAACNAAEIVESSIEALRPVGERVGVSLTWECDDLRLWAEPDRMTQTITNLVGNSIKFSPVGSTVEIKGRRDGAFALFEIRDHGRGIPQNKLATVFERFQQVDASDAREKGGTGLGLAISRGIVRQHGGRIWAESEPGNGSVFRFTIPLFVPAPVPSTDGPPRAVLVVDDDEDLVEVLCAALVARGCSAVGAHSAGDAIARFDASPSDIVIVDLSLPDVHGREIIRHIHSTSPRTRIIVYTATNVDRADRDFVLSAGARVIIKGRMTLGQVADEAAKLVNESTNSRTAEPHGQDASHH